MKEKQVKLKAEKIALQKTSLLKRKCKKLRKKKTSIDKEAVQQILEENKKEVRITRGSFCNRFNDNVRMTIINLQEVGISATFLMKSQMIFPQYLHQQISVMNLILSPRFMLQKRSYSHQVSHSIQMD